MLVSLSAQDRVQRNIPASGPRSPQEQQGLFQLPPGFRIELVASEPDIQKPINMNFDAAGRLLVSQSVEYPFAPLLGSEARDSIKLLSDQNGDGVPETVDDFAQGLSIPVGVTPVPDGAIGLSIPNLYRFYDDDKDGRSDRREVAYGPFGYGDTHGMVSSLTWWIDGWIYGCHSNNNQSVTQGSDGQAIEIKTGNTHRFRPDGSHIEFFTLGQVNPFGITFDPLGNAFNADCHTRPISLLLRGGYYRDVIFKGHDGLGFAPTMMRHNHGSTGLAGIVYYAASQFPESFKDTIFIGNPITGKINHDRLEAFGSSYQAIEQADFLSCDDPWFRPVDLQLAPDGSLYLADFYAPIIAHYEVPLTHAKRDRQHGRIWRISYEGTRAKSSVPPLDLTQASLDELISSLSHDNLGIRTHATHQLVHRIGLPAGQRIQSMLSDGLDARQRAHGIWVLARLGLFDAETVRSLAADPSRLVRVHVFKALAEQRQWGDGQRPYVRRALRDTDGFVRRAAVDALGQHPHTDDVTSLIDLWERAGERDTHLVHAIRIALRRVVENLENLPELRRRYAEQSSYLARLADISLGIRNSQSAEFLLKYYQSTEPEGALMGDVIHHTGSYLGSESMPAFYVWLKRYSERSDSIRFTVFNAAYRAAQERGEVVPDEFVRTAEELALKGLSSSDVTVLNGALEIIQEFEVESAGPRLVEMTLALSRRGPARRTARGRGRPLSPFNALVAANESLAVSTFVQMLLDPNFPSRQRWRMELAIGRLSEPASFEALIEQVRISSEVVESVLVRGLSRSLGGVRALFAAIEDGRVPARLLRDPRVSVNLQYADLPRLDQRLAVLLEGVPSAEEDRYGLIARRAAGFRNAKVDMDRGRDLFQTACAICHQLSGEGAQVGPQLDGVGLRGVDRLLEDIIDPNRNVDSAYRATNIILNDDQLFGGRVLREEGQVIVMVGPQGIEQRIPKVDIKTRELLDVSSMPDNISELLEEQDFYDLIGYLMDQSTK